jgi:hypothetical protein
VTSTDGRTPQPAVDTPVVNPSKPVEQEPLSPGLVRSRSHAVDYRKTVPMTQIPSDQPQQPNIHNPHAYYCY